jgi:hypothetical protein
MTEEPTTQPEPDPDDVEEEAPTPEPQVPEAPEPEPVNPIEQPSEDQPAPPEADPTATDEEPPEVTEVNPPDVLAGTADTTVELTGTRLDEVEVWHLDDVRAAVDVHSPERATLLLPTANLREPLPEKFVIKADDEEVAEVEVKPFLNEEGEPVTEQLYGSQIEPTPNPLRITQ